jgi:transcriptional regulator NrdR family protein
MLKGGDKQMRLKVIKADGKVEQYLHTKVIGTINNALSAVGLADIKVAEELAEVVTYYLHKNHDCRSVTSSEIFSMIKVVLTSTGHEEAAVALSERQFERKLKRSRTEVVSLNVRKMADARLLAGADNAHHRSPWDKSKIVDNLIAKHNVDRQTARMIATMVEERILSLGITLVPVSLIEQLVLGDTASVLRAQNQMAAV